MTPVFSHITQSWASLLVPGVRTAHAVEVAICMIWYRYQVVMTDHMSGLCATGCLAVGSFLVHTRPEKSGIVLHAILIAGKRVRTSSQNHEGMHNLLQVLEMQHSIS